MSIASDSFRALGTTAFVAVTDPAALREARALLELELERIDRACSRFRTDSELAAVNTVAGDWIAVSPAFCEALSVALDAARTTDGLVDPTLGAQLAAAGYDRTFTLVEARDGWSLSPAPARRGDWREIELDSERGLVRIPAGVELDLGATAKALAADRSARAVAAVTAAGTLVSLGGDLAVAGVPPADGWCVAVADDHRSPLTAGPHVLVASGGLATSSTSVRRWTTDSGTAHHLLDPRSGLPASGPWRTISVAAGSCVEANVASTAAVVCGAGAAQWLAERGLPARLVDGRGGVVHVAGWPAEAEAA